MNPERAQPHYARVANASSIAPGTAAVVHVRGKDGRYDVAIFRLQTGDVVAYENACPHQGGPVGEGFIESDTVTCPWHAWCFDLRTGFMTIGDFARLRRFECYVSDGDVYVATEPQPEDAR